MGICSGPCQPPIRAPTSTPSGPGRRWCQATPITEVEHWHANDATGQFPIQQRSVATARGTRPKGCSRPCGPPPLHRAAPGRRAGQAQRRCQPDTPRASKAPARARRPTRLLHTTLPRTAQHTAHARHDDRDRLARREEAEDGAGRQFRFQQQAGAVQGPGHAGEGSQALRGYISLRHLAARPLERPPSLTGRPPSQLPSTPSTSTARGRRRPTPRRCATTMLLPASQPCPRRYLRACRGLPGAPARLPCKI
jgi:hypothetical protein